MKCGFAMSVLTEINLSGLTWLDIFPWALSALSMFCIYFLNNYRVKTGRYLGVVVAIGWFAFGAMTSQWYFLFTNVIYAYIYIAAIIKFNKKRDEYRHITEDQAQRILAMEERLLREQTQFSTRFKEKHRRMLGIAKAANNNAEKIARETRVLLRAMERLEKDAEQA